MKICSILLCLLFAVQLKAQNELFHTIRVNITSKELTETIEVKATGDYLLRIEKGKVIDGKTFSVFPTNYKRFNAGKYDMLLFSSPVVAIVSNTKIPDALFKVSKSGVKTVSVEFNNNYLKEETSIDYDPSTNNVLYSKLELEGDFDIIDYRFIPELEKKKIEGNQISFKGNVNRLTIEVDYVPKKEKIIETKKQTLVEKQVEFKGELTLNVWDDAQEDGDIISLWVGEVCVARELKVSKSKTTFIIKENMFGSSKELHVRIDNVDEGSVPPNTVLVELTGNGVNEIMKVNTTSITSKEIVLVR